MIYFKKEIREHKYFIFVINLKRKILIDSELTPPL
jgi:hypothetical protein